MKFMCRTRQHATKSHYKTQAAYGIITIAKMNTESLMGAIPWGFSYTPEEVNQCQQNRNDRAA